MEPGYYLLRTDGGIDTGGKPPSGEAAIGVILENADGSRVHDLSMRIGRAKDHHVAEYQAVISGLRMAIGHGIDRIRVISDSRLIVNQLTGKAKVTKEHLKPLHARALELLAEFAAKSIAWVPRRENQQADALANRALAPRRASH